MKPIFKMIAYLILLFLGMQGSLNAQNGSEVLSGVFDFKPNGELSILKIFCKNYTPASLLLNYELEIEHRYDQKTDKQEAAGAFDLKPKQKYLIALHTYDYNPDHFLSVKLKVYSAGDLIATDTLLILPREKKVSPEILRLTDDILTKKKEATVEELLAVTEQQKEVPIKKKAPVKKLSPKIKPKPPVSSTAPQKQEPQVIISKPEQKVQTAPPAPSVSQATDRMVLPQEEIGIDGLIIDETRSKMAHDFYDLFYRKWVTPNGTRDFIIYIREMPSRGRISRVALLVNDDEVLQRNLSPRYDLLEEQVNLAIRVLINHLQNKESVKDQLGNEDSMGDGIF